MAINTAKVNANKIRKVSRHIKLHPEDTKAVQYLEDLKSGKISPSIRKASSSKIGWITNTLKTNPKLKSILIPEKRKANLMSLSQAISSEKKIFNYFHPHILPENKKLKIKEENSQ